MEVALLQCFNIHLTIFHLMSSCVDVLLYCNLTPISNHMVCSYSNSSFPWTSTVMWDCLNGFIYQHLCCSFSANQQFVKLHFICFVARHKICCRFIGQANWWNDSRWHLWRSQVSLVFLNILQSNICTFDGVFSCSQWKWRDWLLLEVLTTCSLSRGGWRVLLTVM